MLSGNTKERMHCPYNNLRVYPFSKIPNPDMSKRQVRALKEESIKDLQKAQHNGNLVKVLHLLAHRRSSPWHTSNQGLNVYGSENSPIVDYKNIRTGC